MKQFAALFVAIGLFAAPALAQDANQIAAVKDGKSCAQCNLFQANLSYSDGEKMDLSGARLRQSNLALTTFNDMNLAGANLSVANLFGARFNRANFNNANFEHATAVGTYFGSSTFTGANLKGANFSGANLALAKGLTQAQLDQACGDDSTHLPKGKTIPRCSYR